MLPLLDTNIFLRHILGDDPSQSARATAYFQRIATGEVIVRTSDLVVFETVFVLQRQYRLPREAIRNAVGGLLDLTGVVLPTKQEYQSAFELYVTTNLSFADAYHVAMMERLGLAEIVSFDRGFDGIPGITRIEP